MVPKLNFVVEVTVLQEVIIFRELKDLSIGQLRLVEQVIVQIL